MVFSAPSINAYKRFNKYYFAPVNQSWGYDNRTIAASLAGGLYGLENELKLHEKAVTDWEFNRYFEYN